MDSSPINFDDARPLGQAPGLPAQETLGDYSAAPIGTKWSALFQVAEQVRYIAGISTEADGQDFATNLYNVSEWNRRLIEQGLEDLAVIMELGLSALLSAQAQGADPRHAAKALWEEFQNARNGLLALKLSAEG